MTSTIEGQKPIYFFDEGRASMRTCSAAKAPAWRR